MPVKLTHEKYIEKVNKVHNNFYDYSETVYTSSHEKIKIKCRIHGVFEQKAYSHASGSGCKECGLEKVDAVAARKRSNIDDIKEQFNKVHDNKYDYSLFTEYKNKEQKIKIKCPIHGVFEQQVNVHKNGSGCKKCSYEYKIIRPHLHKQYKSSPEYFDVEELKIRLSQVYDKNIHEYDFKHYDKYCENTIIGVKCLIHNTSKDVRIKTLLSGEIICDECKNDNKFNYFKDRSYNSFLKEAFEIHGDKFEYIKDSFLYRESISYICKEHGLINNTYYRHIQTKVGCVRCDYKEYFDKYDELYGDVYEYKYDTLLRNKIDVYCKKHDHTFRTNLDKHLTKTGCKQCFKESEFDVKKKSIYESFIKKVTDVHSGSGYIYNYDEFDCMKGGRIKFICPTHGKVEADRKLHEEGSPCYECYKDNFTHTSYIRHLYVDTCLNGSNIYLVKFKSDQEEFYKIGIAKDMKIRLKDFNLTNYETEIVHTVFNKDSGIIWDLEHEVHRLYKENRYRPLEKFGGYTECFKLNEDHINDIIMIFEENRTDG